MLITPQLEFDKLLIKTASALDIPDHVYEDATLKYENVGDWLGAADSELLRYTPEIYVQGSFRLGTVVRPINEEDEYDIDLVCHLDINKEQTTQKDFKEMIGVRLKKCADLARILKSSRRCWTLEYTPQNQMPRFHMDVLPAIPIFNELRLAPVGFDFLHDAAQCIVNTWLIVISTSGKRRNDDRNGFDILLVLKMNITVSLQDLYGRLERGFDLPIGNLFDFCLNGFCKSSSLLLKDEPHPFIEPIGVGFWIAPLPKF